LEAIGIKRLSRIGRLVQEGRHPPPNICTPHAPLQCVEAVTKTVLCSL
jgi:hypothetical protein